MTSNAKLIIIGAGGHARSVYDLAQSLHYEILGFLDDLAQQPTVLGKIQDIASFKGVSFAMGIGGVKNLSSRHQILMSIKPYFPYFVNLISPYSLVSKSCKLGIGNTVHPFAYLNAGVQVGDFCIINSRAIIEHDCQIGNNVHVSTGAIVNGEVKIGNHVFIGSGSLIKNSLEIGDNIIIGMGSVVLHSLYEPGVYVGNPLKCIQKITL